MCDLSGQFSKIFTTIKCRLEVFVINYNYVIYDFNIIAKIYGAAAAVPCMSTVQCTVTL